MTNLSDETIKELAITSGKSIDFVQGITDYISDTLGDPIKGLFQAYITGPVNAHRNIKLITLAARVKEKMIEHNVTDIRSVAPKVILPLIETATLEDDPDLDEMWANLLVSALNSQEDELEKKYISILSDFTRKEADLVKYLYKYRFIRRHRTGDGKIHDTPVRSMGSRPKQVRPFSGAELLWSFKEDVVRSFIRLGILKRLPETVRVAVPGRSRTLGIASGQGIIQKELSVFRDMNSLAYTSFGYDFTKRVILGKTSENKEKRAK